MASISPSHNNTQIPNPSSLLPSPRSLSSNSSTTTSSSNNNNNNGVHSPKPITRSKPGNPYPTTFVQADTSSFKQVVQMLTGSPKPAAANSSDPSPAKTHSSVESSHGGDEKLDGVPIGPMENFAANKDSCDGDEMPLPSKGLQDLRAHIKDLNTVDGCLGLEKICHRLRRRKVVSKGAIVDADGGSEVEEKDEEGS
ncbi:hypothetical protein K1719_019414 [Acacia pycnantha]|nr:hypothetical protein K1719_019414 [Acacia pycnantha]